MTRGLLFQLTSSGQPPEGRRRALSAPRVKGFQLTSGGRPPEEGRELRMAKQAFRFNSPAARRPLEAECRWVQTRIVGVSTHLRLCASEEALARNLPGTDLAFQLTSKYRRKPTWVSALSTACFNSPPEEGRRRIAADERRALSRISTHLRRKATGSRGAFLWQRCGCSFNSPPSWRWRT